MSPYETACAAIDRANADDPRKRELPYSERMVEWAGRLAPRASPELLLAARAQHVRRWTVPRDSYPGGRTGYLTWRETLKKFHADLLGSIMKESGYAEASIAKAKGILLKKNLAADPEGQTLEDAACLVFLELDLGEFAGKTEESKVVEILRKTWEKMSPRARELALALPLPGPEKAVLQRALGTPP